MGELRLAIAHGRAPCERFSTADPQVVWQTRTLDDAFSNALASMLSHLTLISEVFS